MSTQDSSPNSSLGFRSAIIASIILSIVSFLTTWSGLRAADPIQQRLAEGSDVSGLTMFDKAESLAITLGLAFGIQALMLALAWIASRLIMLEQRKRWWLIGSIFLGYFAATTISVTFSYVDLFDRMFSAQKSDWSAETMRERGDVIVEQLIEELQAEVREARSDFSSQQAGFQSQLNVLSEASTLQRQVILSRLDERRSELREYRREMGTARAEARSAAVGRESRIEELEGLVDEFEQQVRTLTLQRDEWLAEVTKLETQSQRKEDEKLLEERGAQDSGQVGRGPRWRELDREHDIIKANLEVATNRLENAERELSNANEALLNSQRQLAIVRGSGSNEEIDQALDAGSDVRVDFLQAEIDALTAQASALEIPQIDFTSENISEDEINQIQSACTQIKSELMSAQATDEASEAVSNFDPTSIDCTSGGAFEAARRLSNLQASVDDVRSECRADSSETYATARGTELLQYIRNECITASALAARDKQDYLEDLRRVARTRDPDAAPIAYSFVALQDREPQAMFAALLALSADLLILLVSLFGNAGHHHHGPAPTHGETVPSSRRLEGPEPNLFNDD
ncbi:MAG: hypothetical protein CMK09_02595 [Ponticaulis sp.]|nr:hypothetical protein [Ponticaulis sp.]|tara:strand:+ start:31198 stop:32925 length:1728 start_codon:yes stop_codon:yes gene_type:complete